MNNKTFSTFLCALLYPVLAQAAQIHVPAGHSITDAVRRAVPGDEIILEAGAVYTEYFTLPDKGSGDPITIRSSAVLPERRITPEDRHLLPSIGSGSGTAPVTITGSRWRLVGLAFRANTNGDGNIIDVRGWAANVVLDRILIEGGESGQKRGVAMNGGGAITVSRSHLANIWKSGQESQGLAAWDGPGPFTIRDNYIQAATENILFGGADSSSDARMPSDILVEGNHLTKNPEWQGTTGRAVKNLFELKAARRVTVRNNLMEHNWVDGQAGWAVVVTPRNQGGTAPWTAVEDVLFEHNIVRHTARGINITGRDDLALSAQTRRITFRNNLFVTDADWLQAGGEIAELTLSHNTVVNGGTLIKLYVADVHDGTTRRKAEFAIAQLVMLDSLTHHGRDGYGIWGEDSGSGTVALTRHTLGYDVRRNVIAGENGWGVSYPADTLQPSYVEHEAQFIQPDYLLVENSPYRGAATDGSDLGRLAGATTDTAATVPNVSPTTAILSPEEGATFNAPVAVRIAATASDSDGNVVRVNFYSGSTMIGTDISAPFEIGWSATPGTYVLTVQALDNAGATTMSAPVSITVLPPAPLPAPWTGQDIGIVGLAGAAAIQDGVLTVQASGADIWGGVDALHYVWQPFSGDVDIVARVASVDPVHAWTKAGVMIRQSLNADSAHGLMLVSPGKGLAFQRRVSTGGLSTSTAGGAGIAPAWVKLERRGNTILAYHSVDGTAWTLVGSDTFTMPADVYVGLAVTSHDNEKLASATFDAIAVSMPPSPAPVAEPVAIETAGVPDGRVTVGYSTRLSATGGSGTYVWTIVEGALPSGLVLDSATGSISGTPQAWGAFAFTVGAADATDANNGATVALSVNVARAVEVATTSLPNGMRKKAYSATLSAAYASGSPVWQIDSGTLPDGLTLNSSSGVISGQPQKSGTWKFVVRVTDASTTATRALSISVR